MMAKTEEKGLETLQIWQRAMAFTVKVCRQVLPLFPIQEKWSLIDQLRRSVQSIPSNIAEGYGRFYYQESIRFCYIGCGSLEETFSHLTLAHNLNYLSDEGFQSLTSEIQEIRRMMNGYISFLKTSKRGAAEPGATIAINDETAPYHSEDFFEPESYLPYP
jgi:four helix bundle protein